jgi:hypothetical protein
MDPFPEEFELIGFFEAEPEISDRDVPWFYNRLKFQTTRGEDNIVCAIEPGYGEMDLIWRKSGIEIAIFALRDVSALFITSSGSGEFMTAMFRYEDTLDFIFHLKPDIKMHWGNQKRI